VGFDLEFVRAQHRDFQEIEAEATRLSDGVITFFSRPVVDPQESVGSKLGHNFILRFVLKAIFRGYERLKTFLAKPAVSIPLKIGARINWSSVA
jgi:hypothetical protein